MYLFSSSLSLASNNSCTSSSDASSIRSFFVGFSSIFASSVSPSFRSSPRIHSPSCLGSLSNSASASLILTFFSSGKLSSSFVIGCRSTWYSSLCVLSISSNSDLVKFGKKVIFSLAPCSSRGTFPPSGGSHSCPCSLFTVTGKEKSPHF